MLKQSSRMRVIMLCGLSAVVVQTALAQTSDTVAPVERSGSPATGPAAECVELATPPVPLAVPAAVEKARFVDWDRAIAVCGQTVRDHPGEPRMEFLLGHAYYKAKNYIQAMRHYQVAADAGYANAADELGVLFVLGLGVVKDYQRAFDLFNKAALGGSPSGMGNLGAMYANGYFVKKDDAKALYWYEKSIEAGSAFGLAQAGVMYFNGQGTPVNYGMAAQYFQQAADLGDGYSLKFLALMYDRGLIGKPDPAKAAALRLKAVEVDPDSQNPNVPAPSHGAQARHGGSSSDGDRSAPRRYAGAVSSGGGNNGGYIRPSGHGVVGIWADPNANKQGYTGEVKRAPTWHGISVALPRCWPMCSTR